MNYAYDGNSPGCNAGLGSWDILSNHEPTPVSFDIALRSVGGENAGDAADVELSDLGRSGSGRPSPRGAEAGTNFQSRGSFRRDASGSAAGNFEESAKAAIVDHPSRFVRLAHADVTKPDAIAVLTKSLQGRCDRDRRNQVSRCA